MKLDGLFGYQLLDLLWGRSLEPSASGRLSCVYVVQPEVGGPFKIGYSETAKLESRLSALQTGCPWKLNLCSLWRGDRDLERDLHTVLASIRMEGEWFIPHPSLGSFLGIKGDDSYHGVPISDVQIAWDSERQVEVFVHTGHFYRAWYMPPPCWVGEPQESHGSYDAVSELGRIRGRHFNHDHWSFDDEH